MKADAPALIFHGICLHLHAPGHQFGIHKGGGHPVEHMIPGGGHIVRHLIFKGQHPLHVHIPGAGDEIFFVGVFTGKLKADEVTAVIEVPVVHKIILVLHPAGGLHLADALPLFCGHQVHADAGLRDAAAAQAVQLAVILIGIGGVFLLRKGRLIPVDDGVSAGAVIVRDIR